MEVLCKNTRGNKYEEKERNPQQKLGNTKQEMDLLTGSAYHFDSG
jgi:hypothetical protein